MARWLTSDGSPPPDYVGSAGFPLGVTQVIRIPYPTFPFPPETPPSYPPPPSDNPPPRLGPPIYEPGPSPSVRPPPFDPGVPSVRPPQGEFLAREPIRPYDPSLGGGGDAGGLWKPPGGMGGGGAVIIGGPVNDCQTALAAAQAAVQAAITSMLNDLNDLMTLLDQLRTLQDQRPGCAADLANAIARLEGAVNEVNARIAGLRVNQLPGQLPDVNCYQNSSALTNDLYHIADQANDLARDTHTTRVGWDQYVPQLVAQCNSAVVRRTDPSRGYVQQRLSPFM